MRQYIAVNGDTWDSIAYKFYNDEFLFARLQQENQREYPDMIMFEGGEIVQIPDVLNAESKVYKAPWGD